jgi:hypothetical protein
MPSVAPVGRILLPLLCSVSPELYYNFTFLNTFTYVQHNAENWYFLLVVFVDNIESFIDDQAFLPSYEMAPPPTFSPSTVSKLSLFLSLPVCRCSSLLTRKVGGGGGGSNLYVCEKALSSIDHSILSEY